MTVQIIRKYDNGKATIGKLSINGVFFCVTLELPYENNLENVSCIPEGTYNCVRIISPKFGDTFCITGIPGRKYVEIHWGNYEKDTDGCVLIGDEVSEFEGDHDILNSRITHKAFMNRMIGVQGFTMEIESEK